MEKTETQNNFRTGTELIKASLPFAKENITKSWFETILSLSLFISSLALSLYFNFIPVKIFFGILSSLLMVRSFIIYHDYLHYAILKNSVAAKILMGLFGHFVLSPMAIWKRTHDHHHQHNAKLNNTGIGAYPLLDKKDFEKLSKGGKRMYLATRHPLTVLLGYFTLFIIDFNIVSLIRSPKNHWSSALTITIHFAIGYFIYQYLGWESALFSWFLPFLVAHAMGSYLFYAQHNFPGAKFKANDEWDFTEAALYSTSYLKTNVVMNWFTGDIGYHHVHHLNHHIPFYRLKEAMAAIPEMQHPVTTSFHPKDIIACFKLKVWDSNKQEMTGL